MPFIKNIIFDFGGVIIDIDFDRTLEAFKELGAGDFDEKYSKAAQSGIFDELDKGKVSAAEFVKALSAWLPKGTGDAQIIDAWNRIIIGIPEHRIELLRSLRNNYNCILLSNTNCIHYDLYTPDIRKQYGTELESLFDVVFLSFKLGMRKPDREIFDYVFEKTGIKKEESLFIDDSLHIIEAARSYGINALWLEDGMDVTDLFVDGKLRM
jgi:putative hydrolase of the HAD superfamily